MINVLKLIFLLYCVFSSVVYAVTDTNLQKEELPFPFVQVPVERALAEFLRLQKTEKESTPVLLGTPETIRKYAPGKFTENASVEATLNKAGQIDIKKWLVDRAIEEELGELPSGEWPSEEAGYFLEVSVYQPAWIGEHPQVVIGLIPTKKPWEIFAYLNWGGWNSNPMPEEHVAVFKYWHEKYNAVPVSVVGDVVQVMLEKVPDTKDKALELAKEQAIYNMDLIYQGEESLQALANNLINQKVWFFWWD